MDERAVPTGQIHGGRIASSEPPARMSPNRGCPMSDAEAEIAALRKELSERRASEEQWRSLVAMAPDYVAVTDLRGTVQYINRTASGRRPEDVIGTSIFEFVAPDHVERFREHFVAVRHADAPITCEVLGLAGGGRYAWYSMRLGPYRARGTLSGVIVLVTNIDERKQMDDLLRVQRDVAVALSTTDDLDLAMRVLLEELCHLAGIDCAGVYLVEEDTGSLTLVADRGITAAFRAQVARYPPDSPNAVLAKAGAPTFCTTAQTELQQAALLAEGIRAFGTIPVLHRGEAIAALNIASRSYDAIPPAVRGVAEAIAAQLGAVIARLRTAAALRQSESRFRTLFDTVTAAAIILEGDRIQLTNQATARMTGYTHNELLAIKASDLVHPDDRAFVLERQNARFRGKPVPARYEFRVQTKSGQARWVDIAVSVFDAARRQSLVTAFDITDRKLAEDALRESESRYRYLLQAVPVVVYMAEIDPPKFVLIDGALEEFVGYTQQDFYENYALSGETVHPDDRERVFQSYATGLASKRPFAVEYRVIHRTRPRQRWVQARIVPIVDAAGRLLRQVGVAVDITERRETELAFQESEKRYRELVTNLPTGIVVFGPDGTVELSNAGAQRLLNVTERELAGRVASDPALAFVGDDGRALRPEQHPALRVLRTRRPAPPVILGVRRSGAPAGVRLLVGAFPVFDAADALQQVIMSLTDFTELHRAQEEARQHQAPLAHMTRINTMGEMATGLAHEINQPLATITTYAQGGLRQIHEQRCASCDLAQPLEQILAQAQRAGQVIQRLREFTRKHETRRRRLNLNRVVETVVAWTRTEARSRRVAIRLDLHEALPDVAADDVQIQQVLLNLIRNAIEAMNDANVAERRVTIGTRPGEDAGVEVRIADTGPGVPPDIAGEVFHQFFTTKPEGMGMGLAISRSIVEAHRGRLWLERSKRRGATFRFWLPRGTTE
jgi:PAS domain S-box-containing protein